MVLIEFLSENRLNEKQRHFVKLIVDYIVVDRVILQQEPFRTVGSIITLFLNNMNDATAILDIVDEIKLNSEQVV